MHHPGAGFEGALEENGEMGNMPVEGEVMDEAEAAIAFQQLDPDHEDVPQERLGDAPDRNVDLDQNEHADNVGSEGQGEGPNHEIAFDEVEGEGLN